MDKVIDYFPIFAYFQGAVLGALLTGEPKLMALGVVTTPAILAMVIAIVKIYRAHRQAG
jgi:uncharacterized membrane protein YoaK (UPF0700 family)